MSKRLRSTSRSPSAGPSLDPRSRSSSPASSTTSLGRTKIHLGDPANTASAVMHCSLPPHRGALSFSSYEEYEVHYMQTHVNRCAECGKSFPTGHFLSLHIEENHDPLIATKRERGDKTMYNFYIVNDGIDKQTSLLRSTNHPRHRMTNAPASPQEDVCTKLSTSEERGY
ncbi:uncharacterized protein KD926_008436 [Aspergillus affinis]|uniref:uncharacterized protein n=1 Tax=Aspergillus affinis TaxID=1070780 RepID=UPI0022FE6F39|nr:uncharacterized protein KD926_008436 [Aspergillus affinis]KAI9040235.1 hypothetical protein KD926_008436 [Aspergillus affinis]